MSDKKGNIEKKETDLSLYEEKTKKVDAKNVGASISLMQEGEMVECDKKTPIYNKAFKKDDEVVVVSPKKMKGYAPTVFAIILFSGLLFLNIYNQIQLDTVGNDVAAMNRQLAEYETEIEEYEQKLAKKDKEVLETAKDYIENKIGMVEVKPEDKDPVYVELQLDDETLVIDEKTEESGWTTLLSSMGRFFSDVFS